MLSLVFSWLKWVDEVWHERDLSNTSRNLKAMGEHSGKLYAANAQYRKALAICFTILKLPREVGRHHETDKRPKQLCELVSTVYKDSAPVELAVINR